MWWSGFHKYFDAASNPIKQPEQSFPSLSASNESLQTRWYRSCKTLIRMLHVKCTILWIVTFDWILVSLALLPLSFTMSWVDQIKTPYHLNPLVIWRSLTSLKQCKTVFHVALLNCNCPINAHKSETVLNVFLFCSIKYQLRSRYKHILISIPRFNAIKSKKSFATIISQYNQQLIKKTNTSHWRLQAKQMSTRNKFSEIQNAVYYSTCHSGNSFGLLWLIFKSETYVCKFATCACAWG